MYGREGKGYENKRSEDNNIESLVSILRFSETQCHYHSVSSYFMATSQHEICNMPVSE